MYIRLLHVTSMSTNMETEYHNQIRNLLNNKLSTCAVLIDVIAIIENSYVSAFQTLRCHDMETTAPNSFHSMSHQPLVVPYRE